MLRIVHLIPYDGLGGVEAAANSLGRFKDEILDFKIDYIFENVKGGKETIHTYNIFSIIYKARVYLGGEPDVLIVSLWRSCLVGFIVKLFRKNIKLILFLHCSEDKHWIDRIATRMAAFLADEIWADSKTTLTLRLPFLRATRCRVISFVTRRFEPRPQIEVEPSFIFWGRLTAQKGIDRAIRIFAAIREKLHCARFQIIGPDAGSLGDLKLLCDSLGLNDAITFSGAATHDEITVFARNASFYLQTSEYEGMAMSVVESMQMGLVPVVTAVGEISSYCRNGYNGIVVESDQQSVEAILQLLHSNERYQALRSAAIATWKDQMLYRDSILQACKDIYYGI